MREIKFRAWHKTDNIMWFPSLMEVNGGGALYSYEGDGVPHYPSKCKLMQYTGIKDKNGKEIYIGDILKVTKAYNSYSGMNSEIYGNYKVQVKEKQCLGFYLEGGNEGIYKGTEFEVIGNIYENPKLLESK